MPATPFTARTAFVIGASGQDGFYLTRRLLSDGWRVYAFARRPEACAAEHAGGGREALLRVHGADVSAPSELFELLARERPEEVYNLAGQSSVSRSFAEPYETWQTNAGFVAGLLEQLRLRSPETRLYQASSTDMFGGAAGATLRHNEESALDPHSPYASAKAAAHLLCRAYRVNYNLRVACGILSNHESCRRPAHFLTRKIADHARALRQAGTASAGAVGPLKVGHLKIRRDWGFAPDYAEGMRLILRQIDVRTTRAEQTREHQATAAAAPPLADEGRNYHDYILGTGRSHAVWQLVDVAFRLAGHDLEWSLEGDDPAGWRAVFRSGGASAVVVDPALLRPSDPLSIQVDVSRARLELGWSPRAGLEVFLADMLGGGDDGDDRRAEGAARGG